MRQWNRTRLNRIGEGKLQWALGVEISHQRVHGVRDGDSVDVEAEGDCEVITGMNCGTRRGWTVL